MTLRNRYDALLDRLSKIRLFEIGYVLYYFTLFFEDLPLDSSFLFKLLRYSAYLCFAFYYLATRPAVKQMICAVVLFAVNFAIGFEMRDFYWAILMAMLFAFRSAEPERILKMSFNLLLALTVATLCLAIVGALPNLNTMRGGDGLARYSMGFYHSNVFPLAVFHLFCLRILILSPKQRMPVMETLYWVILTIVTYFACGSRNALIGTGLCIVAYFVVEYVTQRRIVRKVLLFASKWIVCFCVLFSVILMLLQGTNITLVHRINGLFSGRFGLAYTQMKETGLALINTMPRSMFGVLDNGYLFIVLRYGVVYVVFYMFLQYYLSAKYKGNLPALAVFTVAAIMNMVDNDLLSYGFLPLMVLAVSRRRLKWHYLVGRKRRAVGDRISGSNNCRGVSPEES